MKEAIRFSFLILMFLIPLTGHTQKQEETVYITKTGEKYHVSSCQYLKRSSIEIKLDQAEKNGYTPCSVCKPRANKARSTTSSTPASVKQGTSRQCTGTTQKGLRCKRMTTAANGRCYQH